VAETLRARLQLVGIGALLIASKWEEIFPPEVKDCVCIADYAYEGPEVLDMENKILIALNYEVFVPTGYHFLQRYLDALNCPARTRCLANFYAERNLQESDSLSFPPHVMAAASVFGAIIIEALMVRPASEIVIQDIYPAALELESGVNFEAVQYCCMNVLKHVGETPETASRRKLEACRKKYERKYTEVTGGLVLPAPINVSHLFNNRQ
jgi:hypothetical protein